MIIPNENYQNWVPEPEFRALKNKILTQSRISRTSEILVRKSKLHKEKWHGGEQKEWWYVWWNYLVACTIIKDENFEDSKKMKGKSKKKRVTKRRNHRYCRAMNHPSSDKSGQEK